MATDAAATKTGSRVGTHGFGNQFWRQERERAPEAEAGCCAGAGAGHTLHCCQVDGHDVRDLTMDSLQGIMTVVPQDIVLFNDTVRQNIAYGNFDASDEEIEAAAS